MTMLDSLKTLKAVTDSLKEISSKAPRLFPIRVDEPPVQAALIVALTTILTVALGFLIKDYWIPGLAESRTTQRVGQEIFKRYKNHLFKSALNLSGRINELYRNRSHYLRADAPKSEFYDYKYKSSVYRLCVLLGWIRAYRLEEAKIAISKSDKKIHDISNAIDKVGSDLADGQLMEMYIAKAVCRLNGLVWADLDEDILETLSVDIDHLIHQYQYDYSVRYMSELPTSGQDKFVSDLTFIMAKSNLPHTSNESQKRKIIEIVSVKLGLIYRDWQNAIGDLMLEKNEEGGAAYNVIGYRKFELMWSKDNSDDDKKWLIRAEKMFESLDLRNAETTDSRVRQLARVYLSLYALICELYKTDVGGRPVSAETFNAIPKDIFVTISGPSYTI